MIWPIIYNCNLKNSDMNELTHKQCVTFCSFIMLLSSPRRMSLVARGESDDNLSKHYNVNTSDPQLLAQIMFNIGAKGRLCLHKEYGIDPDDTSPTNFKKICELMRSALRNAGNGTSRRAIKMKSFISDNKCFVDEILNFESKLISKYDNLSTTEKRDINIYYLYILHTINSHKYNQISNFVSSSEYLDVAKEFAQNLLIVGWIPTYTSLCYISSHKNHHYGCLCKSKQFPYINSPVYPEQAEISLRCGILPHFIIGFRIQNDFYVNPAIFETMNMFTSYQSDRKIAQLRDEVIKHGLRVDQSKFSEYCKMTNYKRYFTFDGQQYKNHNLV